MSSEIQHACDHCNTIAIRPAFHQKGWIHFDDMSLRYSTGNAYITKKLINMDFCNNNCFHLWLDAQSTKS